jgi:hypothetical protein
MWHFPLLLLDQIFAGPEVELEVHYLGIRNMHQ